MARQPFSIREFRGLDNRNAPETLVEFDRRVGTAFATIASNVDFDTTFGVYRRQGWSLSDAGEFHSLWTNPAGDITFCVKDSEVGILSESLAFSGLLPASEKFFTYADTGAGIYFSDGQRMAVYSEGTVTVLAQAGTYDFASGNALDLADDLTAFDSPPPGSLVMWMFGRLWVATEEGVFFSRGHRPDQFNLADDYLDMPGVVMLAPTASGYYLGTRDQVFYIAGKNPKEPIPTKPVTDFGVFPRSFAVLPAKQFGEGGEGDVVVWESPKGKILGADGGNISLLTDTRIAYPEYAEYAATLLREVNGQIHHVAALAQPSTDGSNMRTTDIAVAEIRRNGIII